MIYKPNFFIITGGPGVGKTTLLEVLAKQGFPYVPEVARKIIREQVSQNGDALPWANIPAYTHLMLSRSVESFEQHQKQESVLFFDRGIPDTLAYAHLTHQPILPELRHTVQAFRYNTQVFILPPWSEIYKTDSERRQSYQEAIETYDIMFATYQQLGYTPIIVPKGTPEERAEFVVNALKKHTPDPSTMISSMGKTSDIRFTIFTIGRE